MTDSLSPDFSVAIQKPEGWSDRSMTIYALRTKSGFDANIVLARDAMLPNENFESYCERQRQTFENSLPKFTVEREQTGLVNDYQAHEMLFAWESGPHSLRQRAVFISVGRGRVATFASTALVDDYKSMERDFDEAFSSMKIEGGDPPEPLQQFMN